MQELHKKDGCNAQVKTEEVQSFLCDHTIPTNKYIPSEDTLKSISKLSEVLQRIDRRMKREGFCIKDGKIIKNENT